MKYVLKTSVGLIMLCGMLILLMSFKPVGKYPDGYIPMWVDSGDTVSTLINTRQIIMITPKTHPELLLGHDADKAFYLEVKLSNGEELQIFEPFDEFVERIRRNQ